MSYTLLYRWLLFITLHGIGIGVFAQELSVPTLTEQDSIQIYALGNKAFSLRTSNPDSALLLADQALSQSVRFNHLPSQVSLWRIKGLAYQSLKQYEAALESNHKALALAEQIDYRVGTIRNTLANVYFYLDDYDNAIYHYEKALEDAVSKKDTIAQIDVLHNLGSVATNDGKHETAYTYYLQSLSLQRASNFLKIELTTIRHIAWAYFENNEIQSGIATFNQGITLAEEREDWKSLALMYRYLGAAYNKKGWYDKSLEAYQQELNVRQKLPADRETVANKLLLTLFDLAEDELEETMQFSRQGLQIATDNQDEPGEIEFLRYIGFVYALQGKCDSAIVYLNRTYGKLEHRKLSNLKASVLYMKGDCFEQLNQLDSALVYLNQALPFAKNSKWISRNSEILIALAKVYIRKNEYELGLQYLEESLQLAVNADLPKQEADARWMMYELLDRQQKFSLALVQLKRYQELQDFLAGEERTKKVAQVKAKYEFEKEKESILLQSEREKQSFDEQIKQQRRWTLWTTVGLFLSLLLLCLIYRFQKTKRKNAVEQEKLKAALQEEKLKKATEMDAFKTKLFVNISHELRTPLSIIMGMNEKTHENPAKWSDEAVSLIRKNTYQLLNLTNQILEFHKLESQSVKVKLEQGDIVIFLKYILSSIVSLALDKNIQLQYQSSDPEIIMDHDKEKLQWIVANLLSNAIKFTPKGGRVTLAVRRSNDHLTLQVEDTGVGISKADQPYVFDRYFQVENEVNPTGSGIGLSLVKELVNLLDGSIQVSSEENIGSTFTVALPITQNAPVEDTTYSDNHEQVDDFDDAPLLSELLITPDVSHHRHELLIVEDHPDMVRFLKACLATKFKIHTADSGKAGIEKAIELVPDLIISDVMMPLKNGFELCEALKSDERTSHIPIILLTAKADMQAKLSGLSKGADAFLSKPFNEQELNIRLEQLLQLRVTLQKKYATLPPPTQVQQVSEPTIEDRFINKIITYVEERMSIQNFDIEDLSQHLQMSRSQVYRKVKAITGKSPSLLIRSVRLRAAFELLQTTQLTVTEVAYEVGFSSSSYFSNSYYDEFNHRPSEVAKQRQVC